MKRLVLTIILVMLILPGLSQAADPDYSSRMTAPRAWAPVQDGFQPTGQRQLPHAPDRLLVKFHETALQRANLDMPMLRGRRAVSARTGLNSVDALAGRAGLLSIERPYDAPQRAEAVQDLGIDRWYLFRFGAGQDMAQLAREFAADPAVESVSLDWVAFPAAVPGDPLYPDHWGHNNTAQLPDLDWGGTYDHTLPTTVGTPGFDANAEAAWDGSQGYGSSSVIIAILDSGVDVGHPDLNQVSGYDFGDNDSNPDDDSADPGHGTACAGVAASARNGLGAVGIAAGCQIMPCKVADSGGTMYFSYIQNALYWAADNGADIISMSLGAAISSDGATDTALNYAYNAGVVILAATGNSNSSTIDYPAIHGNVIGVGAASPCGERKRSSSSSSETNPGVNTDPNGYTCDGERWWGSSYGTNSQDASGAVDVIAPTILPTTDIAGSGGYENGDYEDFFNGTSCATPYAAGVCALIKSANPGWSNAQIRDQLVNSAQDVTSVESGSGWDRYSGYGMVDAEAAVGGGGPVAPTAAFSGSPTSGTFPLSVSFTDLSTGSPTGWSWTFGDGGSSSAQNPGHTYTAAGDYTVNLTVSNSAGSDGETKVAYISVNDPADTYAGLPYSTGFESGSLDQYWSFTEGVEGRVMVTSSYSPHSGSYQLTLDDTVNGGSYSLNEALLHLNLAGQGQVDLEFWWKEFGDETHSQDGIYFSDDAGANFTKVQDLNGGSTSNQSWQNFQLDLDALAAGGGLSLTSTFVVKFQQYDNYTITTDGFAFDDINVTAGATGNPPTANFSGSPTSGVAPLAVNFTDSSTDAPTSWSWTFGDGGSSTDQNPSHSYTTAGTYSVSLTASNTYGSDGLTRTDYITVTEPSGGGDWVTITYDDFESGWGNYQDGGNDCRRYTGGTYAWEGSDALNIQDNSGVASSFYHASGQDVSGFVDLEVEFYFVAVSMDNSNEDFWVQYYDGSTWHTVATFARNTDFDNGVFYSATVGIPASYNYPSDAKLRFMCDASGNRDDVYIDAITFRGLTAGGSSAGGVNLAALPRTVPLPRETVGLDQNHPNPFNPVTTIKFSLEASASVTMHIFDITGRKVATLADGYFEAGDHSLTWNADHLASGTYFYRIKAGDYEETRRMVLLK